MNQTEELPNKPDLLKETIPEPFQDVSQYRLWTILAQYLSRTRPDLKPILVYLTSKCEKPTTKGDFETFLSVTVEIPVGQHDNNGVMLNFMIYHPLEFNIYVLHCMQHSTLF